MAKEGLAYCATRRTRGPRLPPASSDILNDLLDFCLNGVQDDQRNALIDPDTNKPMSGTINWLASLGKFEANFYVADFAVAGERVVMFFVSLPDGSDDWRKNPGFMLFVRDVDLTLKLSDKKVKGQVVSTGKFILEPRPELDKALADMEAKMAMVSRKNKPRLIAALRGDEGTNLKQVIDELERDEAIGLRDLFDERQKAFETQLAAQAKAQKKPKRK